MEFTIKTSSPEKVRAAVLVVGVFADATLTPAAQAIDYLASSTNPNDDSLNIWLEWLDAPTTILADTTITAEFRIVATHPTDRGDLNHDGVHSCDDLALFDALAPIPPLPPLTPTSPVFNAYADLDKNSTIGAIDRVLLVSLLGGLPADCDESGMLSIDDCICFQTLLRLATLGGGRLRRLRHALDRRLHLLPDAVCDRVLRSCAAGDIHGPLCTAHHFRRGRTSAGRCACPCTR